MGMSFDTLADFGEITCSNTNFFNANDSLDLGVARTTAAGVEIGRQIWAGDKQMAVHFEVTEAFTGAGARAQFGIMYSPNGTNVVAAVDSYVPILTGGPGLNMYMIGGAGQLDLGTEILVPVPRPSRFIAGGTNHPITAANVLTGRHRYMWAVVANLSAGPVAWATGKVRARLVYQPPDPVDGDSHEINTRAGFSVT